MTTFQTTEVVGHSIQVEVAELVVKAVNSKLPNIEVPQLKVNKILFLSSIESILIEPRTRER